VRLLEDRCTPAIYTYAADTQTLTVVGAQNDQVTVEATPGDPTGYLTVEANAVSLFNSATNAQPVRNLIVRFGGVDDGELTISPNVYLGGNLSVFGAKNTQKLISWAAVGGNVNYTASSGIAYDDLTFYSSTTVGGNLNLRLGSGTNYVFLRGGTIGGNLTVLGGQHIDKIELVGGSDLVVGGSATFRLGGATNRLLGMAAKLFNVGKSLSYAADACVNEIDLATNGTELRVGGKATFQLNNTLPAAIQDFLFADVSVGGNMTIVGGAKWDTVEFQSDLDVGGNLTAKLRGGENAFSIAGPATFTNSIGGNLIYGGGAEADQVSLDATIIAKNASFALGGDPSNTQFLHAGLNDADGVHVARSMTIVSGDNTDEIHLRRLYVGSALSVATGAGNNHIYLNDVDVAGSARFDLGAGNDTLFAETQTSDAAGNLADATTFGGTFTIRAGDGADIVNLSDDGNGTTLLRFGAKVVLLGGTGGDSLFLDGNEFMMTGNFTDFDTVNGTLP
jgi:hypothetical protein